MGVGVAGLEEERGVGLRFCVCADEDGRRGNRGEFVVIDDFSVIWHSRIAMVLFLDTYIPHPRSLGGGGGFLLCGHVFSSPIQIPDFNLHFFLVLLLLKIFDFQKPLIQKSSRDLKDVKYNPKPNQKIYIYILKFSFFFLPFYFRETPPLYPYI